MEQKSQWYAMIVGLRKTFNMKFAGHEVIPDEEEKFVSGPRLIPAGLEIDIERMLEWYKQVEEANKKNPVWKRITDEKDEY